MRAALSDAGSLLADALTQTALRSGCPATILGSRSEGWASATFAGARHAITLGADACPALDRWLATLPEAELPLRGHLVADLAVTARRQRQAAVEFDLEVLTVEA